MRHARTLTSSLALATVFGISVAGAPFVLDSHLTPLPNAAAAQGGGSGGSGGADNGTAGSGGDGTSGAAATGAPGQNDGPGVAEERATAATGAISEETEENVYEILGTTREEAEAADIQTSASAQYGPLKGYQTEVERGNLDAAAESLAAIAEEPITEEMVTEVNTELGVDTTLTAQQIAETAARKQDSAK